MKRTNPYQNIIHSRLQVILDLIKEGRDILRIEREISLLALDVLEALHTRSLSPKEGCQCFIKIDYALNYTLRKKLNEKVTDLINEGVLLEEAGDSHGANISQMLLLARKVLNNIAIPSIPAVAIK